nr:unnamed protein product [Spirometra erinaceieuropaei]
MAVLVEKKKKKKKKKKEEEEEEEEEEEKEEEEQEEEGDSSGDSGVRSVGVIGEEDEAEFAVNGGRRSPGGAFGTQMSFNADWCW